MLEQAHAAGWQDAWRKHAGSFPAPTAASVKGNPLLTGTSSTSPVLDAGAQQRMAPPQDPASLKQVFNVHEQGRTRLEPAKKVAEELRLCGTCRKERHYGPCLKKPRTTERVADFNLGVSGNDPKFVGGSDNGPSTSPNYHSATSDSSLARARDGRPADEQAATGFADLFRHLGVTSIADEPGRMTGGLLKQSYSPALGIHSMSENRGPSPNVYEQSLVPGKSPIPGWGDEGNQRVTRAFDQIDGAVDSTNIEGSSAPAGGPAVLG